MRQTLVASLIGHGGLIAALLLLRPPVRHVMPGPESVQVALVEASAISTPAPVAQPPAPEPPKPEPPAQREEEGIKIEKTKPVKQVKPEPPPPAPTPPAHAPPTTPSKAAPPMAATPLGNSGLRGAVSTDAAGFSYDYYLQLVRERIGGLWTPPNGLTPGGEPLRTVVFFRIGRDGRIASMQLESPSGVEFFDRSALRAVLLASPLPPLPLGYASGDLGVHFGFEYVAP